ncbi:ubiquitin-like modifier-activating enzyme 5 [Galdieria sulphuraria]|uniref:Ubiquitin-like modifier-activating enzyme 5 n=1 Tax=Galdieria sulphuraria TaxID=130081 RepID=M2XUT1_GALSU|nr:ubiquitin-like modifier-activating enzyme 5 [Galdieria sulphuraria]EME27174.1 ubiquitin-like modifier-activating enzyme 5 [Galdieria sulphuraria]|eukprot:XP_005703694.1 ubiquitin-like modifier-activating enzyme 5 [Galdieria sulphuraria]
MNEEISADNPYSRLVALKKLGVVQNFDEIRKFSIAVVGLGGVGSVAAEMLVRCGIGKLVLFDYDTVELANMNRLFYKPEQRGKTKVQAAKETLEAINPDVVVDGYHFDITSVRSYDKFVQVLKTGSTDEASAVHLVLSCVDNYNARSTINMVCNELRLTWFESGVSEDALNGHVQFIVPGVFACYSCVPPLLVASGVDESTLKREGVCAASLPTTMGIIAGLLVQNSLKYLLGFGQVSNYIGYNAWTDYFSTMTVKPNDSCPDPNCLHWQRVYQMEQQNKQALEEPDKTSHSNVENPVVHQDNEWSIQVVDDGFEIEEQLSHVKEDKKKVLEEQTGESYAYSLSEESLETQQLVKQLRSMR